MARPIITLTTDYGTSDNYVGVMKGVILNVNPEATIVDISHSVLAHDILDGALTIGQAHKYFPPRTIHLVVVDPGVGTARVSGNSTSGPPGLLMAMTVICEGTFSMICPWPGARISGEAPD